jgi:hypothetical protein
MIIVGTRLTCEYSYNSSDNKNVVFCFVVGTPDELAGQVQKELDILNQMDMSIMKKLATEQSGLSEDNACTSAVSSTVLSQVLSKALREGIGVSNWFVS